MSRDLSIKHVMLSDGERYKVLTDSSGAPLFYPSLYVTAHVRGAAQSVSTMHNTLQALKFMYLWLDHYKIDIEARFKKAELLELHEIISLRDFAKKSMKSLGKDQKVVSLFADQKEKGVGGGSQYYRMTVIADYLRFLAQTLTRRLSDKKLPAQIKGMMKRIKVRRPKKKGLRDSHDLDKGLDDEVLDQLFEVMKPGSPGNPYKDEGVQIRNGLIITLLRFLGIRKGELLNLWVEDINFAKNTLSIVRRPDSALDTRPDQPLVKTRERTLPLDPKLSELLSDYVLGHRSKFHQARRHPTLFVTHKAGPTQGAAFTKSGFGKLMSQLKASAEMFSDVHAHAFRHSWNYGFSQTVDANDSITPEAEEKMRSYLMGWSETSGTAANYNKRHIREKAGEAVLEFQSNISGTARKDNGDN